MFDKPYIVTRKFAKELKGKGSGYLNSKTTYTFTTETGSDYLIEVEEYLHSIYVIKFCKKKLKNHPKRFNLLTSEHKMSKIVSTCIHLMLSILKKDDLASFGFLGSNTIIFGGRVEQKANTKRYRVYKYAVQNLIGEDFFSHHTDINNSTYLVLNKKHKDCNYVLEQANKMFDSIFPDLRS